MNKRFEITCSSEGWCETIGYITLEVNGNTAICMGKEYELINGTTFFRRYNLNNIFKYTMVIGDR